MPITLNLRPPDAPERASRIADGMCAFCEIRPSVEFSATDDYVIHAFCESCALLVWTDCGECGERGVRESRSRYARSWTFHRHLQIAFRRAFDGPGFSQETRSHLDRMARAFASRIADTDDVYSDAFWQIRETESPIYATQDDYFRCADCVCWCDDCGDAFAYLEQRADGDSTCAGCAMPSCGECGERWETQREADGCCYTNGVHDYSYRPDFRFWSAENGVASWSYTSDPAKLFLGMELETECGADYFEEFLDDAREDAQDPAFLYGKTDGSLDESGIEIVTMPSTLDAFRIRFPWDALAKWNRNGARSFYRESCGLHVHVSRAFFTPTHLWRFVAFQMRNQMLCERIAQRNSTRWARWQTVADFPDEMDATLADVVKGKATNGERYVAINFQNRHTVELRYFRGNLRPESILTKMEFVDAVAQYTRDLSAQDVMRGALTVGPFVHFVLANAMRYSALARWMMDNENAWEDA